MADNRTDLDPSTWDPALDAVVAAPKHHKVVFENERLRVLEVTLEPNDEEPIHHPPSRKLGFDAVESDWVTSGPSLRR